MKRQYTKMTETEKLSKDFERVVGILGRMIQQSFDHKIQLSRLKGLHEFIGISIAELEKEREQRDRTK